MEFEIAVDGLDALAEELDARIEDVLPAAVKGVRKASKAIERDARKLSPPPVFHTLIKSIRASEPEINGDAVEAVVKAGAAHAVYVEMGTGPEGEAHHEGIDPEANPTYRTDGWVYPLKDGSGFRYTEGQPARPFMYPAMKKNEDTTNVTVADEVRKVVEK